MVFAQIRQWFSVFLHRFREFFKSGDNLIFFFYLDLVIFAQIQRRSDEIQIAVKMESPVASSSALTDLTAD